MIPRDITAMLKFARKMCPQQDWGPEELERWGILCANVPGTAVDAEEAIIAIRQRQPFMDVAEVIQEIGRIRARRQESLPVYEVPDDGDDDRYRLELLAMYREISSGGRGLAWFGGAIEAGPEAERRAREAAVQARAAAHGQDAEFVRLRDGSLPVGCEWCRAIPGQVCVGPDGKPLVTQPAHRVRLESTEPPLVEPSPQTSPEEALEALRALQRAEEGFHG